MVLVSVAAIGGGVFVGFRHASDVRGDAEPVTRAETFPHHAPHPDAGADFLLRLTPDDMTTYTDPVYGFSFSYPAAFDRVTGGADGTPVVRVAHPTLGLAISITIAPMAQSAARVAELTALSADYDQEAPDGVDSNVQAWIDESPAPGDPHQGQMWFARDGFLYQVVMEAPETDLLESWIHEFLYDNLTFLPR